MTTVEFRACVRREGDRAVIALTGDIDRTADPVLADAYREAGDVQAVVLDFGDVAYINSTGIAVIVGLLARVRAEGRSLVARGLSPHYRRIFEITRLSDFMELEDEEEGT